MNSFNLPPGCDTLPAEENEQLDNRYLAEAFLDHDGPNSLYRHTYTHTSCSPYLSVEIAFWDQSSSEDYHLKSKQIDRGELHELGTWSEMDKRGELVTAILLECFVNGANRCTETHRIEVKQLDEEPEAFVARFEAAVAAVDEEAHNIWDEAVEEAFAAVDEEADNICDDTHGCDTCIAHFNGAEGENGGHPVWADCPDCGGEGVAM